MELSIAGPSLTAGLNTAELSSLQRLISLHVSSVLIEVFPRLPSSLHSLRITGGICLTPLDDPDASQNILDCHLPQLDDLEWCCAGFAPRDFLELLLLKKGHAENPVDLSSCSKLRRFACPQPGMLTLSDILTNPRLADVQELNLSEASIDDRSAADLIGKNTFDDISVGRLCLL